MIDIDSILEEYFPDGDIILAVEDEDLKQAIKEIVEKTLELAAENAETGFDSANNVNIDRQSILSTINQIKF